jgi:hypothetical protein
MVVEEVAMKKLAALLLGLAILAGAGTALALSSSRAFAEPPNPCLEGRLDLCS